MKTTKRQKIRQALLEYFERNGEHEYFGSHLVTHIRNKTSEHYVFEDTILKYCRTLKQEGKINFECINRHDSLYKSFKI